jgi:16S rRNA G1207 methylase RsmC
MDGDHYFSAQPAVSDERRSLGVRLAGRDVEVTTASGVFSGGRLDLGTEVLLKHVPDPPGHGHLLDLGCGWGPIALTMAMLSPEATVWAVDVNDRALELVAENAARLGLLGVRPVRPEDVPDDVTFAALWSNPPIRVGKQALHDLLLTWVPRLAEGASAHLVVQRNLGADSLMKWLDGELSPSFSVSRTASGKGFRVLTATRLAAGRA